MSFVGVVWVCLCGEKRRHEPSPGTADGMAGSKSQGSQGRVGSVR